MIEGLKPNESIEGSAYDQPFSLHPFMFEAIKAMETSDAMRKILGDRFVGLYCAVKYDECREFQEIVTPWEREVLLLNV